jgi:surface antigen
MKAVTINKTDTCLTYVLKRLGKFKKNKNYSLENVEDLFVMSKLETLEDLKIGNIIFWNARMTIERYPISITKEGMIVSSEVQRHVHVGIIESISENQILFSECTRSNFETGGVSILQIRNMLDLRLPDFVLTFK